jgi:ubiquinone/menaquinone biosynthesis C-methylase UbiE
MSKASRTNLDAATVESFGDEWRRFDQTRLSPEEARRIFDSYFAIFPWESLPPDAEGFDMGCGSGRWARLVAPRVGHLHCIDPSSALEVARSALAGVQNVSFHKASVEDQILPAGSQDFGYSLGVLHHVPRTSDAIASCAAMLRPGAPFLVYLYYAFDNRPLSYRIFWRMSDVLRRVICRMPRWLKHWTTDLIAVLVYMPLARLSAIGERMGFDVAPMPLSHYRRHSLYTMRTDSRDRFGTPLEHRFTREQITRMFEAAGLNRVRISESAPFWCAVGIKT